MKTRKHFRLISVFLIAVICLALIGCSGIGPIRKDSKKECQIGTWKTSKGSLEIWEKGYGDHTKYLFLKWNGEIFCYLRTPSDYTDGPLPAYLFSVKEDRSEDSSSVTVRMEPDSDKEWTHIPKTVSFDPDTLEILSVQDMYVTDSHYKVVPDEGNKTGYRLS